MAASQMHSTLNVPAPGDDMEISSDAGQIDHYDDIDIDLMEPQDEDQDIDYMLEDEQEHNHQDTQPSNRDDVMIDDLDDTIVVEEEMRDDEPDIQLTDIPDVYEELQFPERNDPATQEQPHTQGQPLSDAFEHLTQAADDVRSTHETIPTIYSDPEATDAQRTASEAAVSHDPSNLATSPAATTEALEQASVEADGQDHDGPQESDEAGAAMTEEADAPIVSHDEPTMAESFPDQADTHELPELLATESGLDLVREPNNPSVLDVHEPEEFSQAPPTGQPLIADADSVLESEETSAPSEHDMRESGAETHANEQVLQVEGLTAQEGEQNLDEDSTWTYLHPVTVEYDGIRMSLFPPMEEDPSATYLLQDNSVADKSIAELFADCRHVLGQSIKEEDELEISCDELDLCISEDSKHCTDTSLSQIVHVYVTLVHLDGVESPEPLLIYLTTKTRFSSQLAALFQAESEGRGLSELQLRGSPSHDSVNPNDDDANNDPDVEDKNEPPVQEQLPEGPDNTETKMAESLEQDVTSDDSIPENGEPVPDISSQGPDAADEGEFNSEGYQEGRTVETDAQTLDLEEHADDTTHNPADDIEEARYQDAEQAQNEVEAALEESLSEPTGDIEDGEVGSSGSSTVQGENDGFPIEPPSDSVPVLSSISEAADQEEIVPQSGDSVIADDTDGVNVQTAHEDTVDDYVEHTDSQAAEEQTHDEYAEHAYDLAAVDQEWNPDEYEEEYNAEDANYDDLDYQEGDTSVAEVSWEVLESVTNSDHNNNYGIPLSPSKLPTTPGGLDQIPEEDEEEDSITYDDDLDEEHPQVVDPPVDASQARPTNSPLGKRSREEDTEGGGDDGSDQDPELKRLKSG